MSTPAELELARLFTSWPTRALAQSETLQELRRNAEAEFGNVAFPEACFIEPVNDHGIRGERIVPSGADAQTAIIYHHGGGHVFGSPTTHRHLVAGLAEAAGMAAYNMAYSLAPERPFPAGVNDAVANYRFVLNQGVAPERIVLAGDSAGGNLTVAMLLQVLEEGLPSPAGLLLISPWLDLTEKPPHAGYSFERDPLLDPEALRVWSAVYRGGVEATHPKISPVFADLAGFPPTLVQVGGAEILLEDSLVFARNLALAGGDVQLSVWRHQPHDWPLFQAYLPTSGRGAIVQAGSWARQIVRSR
jgi:acetyl esterase/lipase